MKKPLLTILSAALLTSSSLLAFAADSDSQRPQEGKRQPPQASIDACKNLTEKATCQFTGRNGEQMNGVCALPPADSGDTTLACRPQRDHKDHPGGTPPTKPE